MLAVSAAYAWRQDGPRVMRPRHSRGSLSASAWNGGAGPDLPIRRARGNLADARDLGEQPRQTTLHRGQRVRFGGIRKLADRAGFGGDLEGFAGTGDAVVECRFIMGLGIRRGIRE